MEMEEKRRSGGSTKTSKKGSKRNKALTAEEEARRREELKEKLREKLELEKRALKVVERLLEDSVAEDFLTDCAKFITPANYKDAVEERSIAKLCGYPICPNKLGKIPTQQYKISTKTNKVYDITERKCYCSNFCYKASKEFELQISTTPLWNRQHESPPVIKLLKRGDGGSSGEEVMLSTRCLTAEDIENPQPAQPDDLHSSTGGGLDHGDCSEGEQEQDFVSSVVSEQQRPRVHWGDLPKRTDDDKEREPQNQSREQTERSQNVDKKGSPVCSTKVRTDTDEPRLLHRINTNQKSSVEEATAKLHLCSLSETVAQDTVLSVDSAQRENTAPLTSPPSIEPTVIPSTVFASNQTVLPNQPGLNITQVGMSKRGAAGLRGLLKYHSAEAKSDSVRQNLLEGLRKTLKEWCTDETLKFLYGASHSLAAPFTDVEESKEEEELDEDDLEDTVTANNAGEQKGRAAAARNYETLRKQTQEMELRVREFYNGMWNLPEEVNRNQQVTVQEQGTKDPVLPLIDSHAQHLIQKRITVEKLNNCLRNIVGPLHLTMSDVSNDLNNLVRTFRFTNTNIIHKTPEWTLIAVVLLHLLSEVSLVVRDALEESASVEYLNTLMEELCLHKKDLLNLVQLFKSPTH
ncbi:putative RNA polymerase II subunit B1 CTD phosphatase rpap2 [Parambassis ranga]|uniref:RNA polymerase II subunit B1 CTD phosphatase RPAP2 homolog n=1 Tax=Parambassis ranga TaxID=210632 RepID=A0A6P7KA47_9TELE|nr:putative RNA polymerase II subunit B1 CTD phosphatase RPAP2 [Parambassis ranga]XP_028284361.1 putative RNA polymerase II subunit B1 CTD phosphatase RPAP2 [Parambassis ranga]